MYKEKYCSLITDTKTMIKALITGVRFRVRKVDFSVNRYEKDKVFVSFKFFIQNIFNTFVFTGIINSAWIIFYLVQLYLL